MQTIVRTLRETTGLSQQDTAKRLYVSRTTYQKFERGEYDPPLSFVLSVAHLFDVEPRLLLPHTEISHDIGRILSMPLYFKKQELTCADKRKIFLFIRLLKEGDEDLKENFLNLL